ncbi:MAG: nuclear transport factor 2 family protein [Acidimicrobiia bacterium]
MADVQQQIQDLLDRDEIERLLIRYCNTNDADDWAGMASCYVEEGREARTEGFSKIRDIATTMMPIDHIDHEQHIVSNVEITLDGDTASSFCAARVYIVGTLADEPHFLMRGITYKDKLVRTSEGWRISERAHHLEWMIESKPVEGAQVGERIR